MSHVKTCCGSATLEFNPVHGGKAARARRLSGQLSPLVWAAIAPAMAGYAATVVNGSASFTHGETATCHQLCGTFLLMAVRLRATCTVPVLV